MPKVRPFTALAVAVSLSACAAGGHNVPDEAAEGGVRHESLVAGSAIPATMPFAGTIYPVPPSHHAPATSSATGAAPDHIIAPEADTVAGAAPPPASEAPAAVTATPPPAAGIVSPTPPAPDADSNHDEHEGHAP